MSMMVTDLEDLVAGVSRNYAGFTFRQRSYLLLSRLYYVSQKNKSKIIKDANEEVNKKHPDYLTLLM